MHFGDLVRRYREVAGLTQEQLAEQAGLSVRGISDLERGHRRAPYADTVRRLADALGLAGDARVQLQTAARRAPRRPTNQHRALPSTRGLPAVYSSFVGRGSELGHLGKLLRSARLATLTGAGGIGKTRLAVEAARRVDSASVDEVVFVDLSPLDDASLVPQTLASALNVAEEAGKAPLESVAGSVAAKRLLLVLDNCEHLVSACAELVEYLLASCPRMRVLATSREPLHVAGEAVVPVPPLPVSDSDQPPSIDRLAQYSAVHLFVERARAVWPTFLLTEHNARAVAEVCRQVDGIPLAIELAAARTRVLSVDQIEARLTDRFRLLAMGPAIAPPRHQTLLAAVDWSYALLSDEERSLFERISVFRGGCALEAVETVCGDRQSAVDVLHSLVDKSLVVADPGADGAVRFRLLETLREYAAARLFEHGGTDLLRRRHLAYYLDLAEGAEAHLRGPDQRAWLNRLEREHDNVRAALTFVQSRDDALAEGLRLAAAIWWFWDVRGHVAEGRRWLNGLLDHAAHVAPSVRARALNAAGALAQDQADYQQAWALHEEGLALRRQLGDERGMAHALNNLGVVALVRGDGIQAHALFEECLVLRRKVDDRSGTASTLGNLGIVARLRRDYAQAAAFYEEALSIFRGLGDTRGESNLLLSLGNVAQDRGDLSLATERYREGLGLCHALMDWVGAARCIEGLAGVFGKQGQPRLAAWLLGAADALRETIGIPITASGRPEYEAWVGLARDLLGESAFATAWSSGRALPVEDAIRLARGE